jgi:hypothetical protein
MGYRAEQSSNRRLGRKQPRTRDTDRDLYSKFTIQSPDRRDLLIVVLGEQSSERIRADGNDPVVLRALTMDQPMNIVRPRSPLPSNQDGLTEMKPLDSVVISPDKGAVDFAFRRFALSLGGFLALPSLALAAFVLLVDPL